MTTLIDTDVLVDCLRGTAAAQTWLNSVSAQSFLVPGVVAMELVMGCNSQADLQRIGKFLNLFEVAWPTALESEQAYTLLTKHHLSSGLSIPDCLIAAMALARNAQLYTFNTKHFQVIAQLDVTAPYSR